MYSRKLVLKILYNMSTVLSMILIDISYIAKHIMKHSIYKAALYIKQSDIYNILIYITICHIDYCHIYISLLYD